MFRRGYRRSCCTVWGSGFFALLLSVTFWLTPAASIAQVGCLASDSSLGGPTIALEDGSGTFFERSDGKLARIRSEGDQLALYETSDGVSWLRSVWERPSEFSLSSAVALSLPDGDTLIFYLRKRCIDKCMSAAETRFIDIWVTQWSRNGVVRRQPRPIYRGYVGSLVRAVLTRDKHIILPFAAWKTGLKVGPPTGPHEIKLLRSGNMGETFQTIDLNLEAPVPSTNLRAPGYGAIEPTVGRLPDGSLLMLVRTQNDELWESRSLNGVEWGPLRPSGIPAPSAPANLVELRTGDLVLVLNNSYQPSTFNQKMIYGGRDVLHAAIFSSTTLKWRGFRAIYIDSEYLDVIRGDSGTAYPAAFNIPNSDEVIVAFGQGAGRRRAVRFHPEWLEAKQESDDAGIGKLGWVGFREIGGVSRFKRLRMATIQRREKLGRLVTDFISPSGGTSFAMWNFPAATKGQIKIALAVRKNVDALHIALLNRFSNPYDFDAPTITSIDLPFDPTMLDEVELAIFWNVVEKYFEVRIGSVVVGWHALSNSHEGIPNYLRLGFTASQESSDEVLATAFSTCFQLVDR